uniref:Uncharacterized protein n=1 Tax=Anguilla anguilla TaxID=7936 RepID=A0A0E9WFJ5_ANGAN
MQMTQLSVGQTSRKILNVEFAFLHIPHFAIMRLSGCFSKNLDKRAYFGDLF